MAKTTIFHKTIKDNNISMKELLSANKFAFGFIMKNAAVYIILDFVKDFIAQLMNMARAFISKYIIDDVTMYITNDSFDDAALARTIQLLLAFFIVLLYPKFRDLLNNWTWSHCLRRIYVRFPVYIINNTKNIKALRYKDPKFNSELDKVKNCSGTILSTANDYINMISIFSEYVVAIIAVWTISPVFVIIGLLTMIEGFYYAYKWVKNDYAEKVNITEKDRRFGNYNSLFYRENSLGEMKLFNNRNFFINRMKKLTSEIAEQNLKRELAPIKMDQFITWLIGSLNFAACIYLAYLILIGQKTVGDFVLFRTASGVFFNSSNLFYYYKYCIEHMVDIVMMKRFLDNPDNFEEEPRVFTELHDVESVRFENVSFKYKDDADFVVDSVNFEIGKGEYIALVGLNGAGKSTLIKLLCGIYTPTTGTIYYNDIPHYDLNQWQIRETMALVSQDFAKYGVSFKDNITFNNYNGRVDFDSLANSIKLAELFRDVEVEYDKMLLPHVNDNAVNLSEGQWQRIAVARGLYKPKTDILVMDEPSSALDSVAENLIYTNVKDAAEFNFKIIVTHRLACVKDVSRVIVMQDGHIAEDGTHNDLMSQGNLYSELFSVQVNKYN